MCRFALLNSFVLFVWVMLPGLGRAADKAQPPQLPSGDCLIAGVEKLGSGAPEAGEPLGTEADLCSADRLAEWEGAITGDGYVWDMFAGGIHPSWSPDGKTILFRTVNMSPNKFGGRKLWLMDAETFEVKLLTHGISNEAWPEYSPDGKYITFISDRPLPPGLGDPKRLAMNLWIMDADGSNPRPLTTCFRDLVSATWSPTGKQLLLTTLCFARGRNGVYLLDLSERTLRYVPAPTGVGEVHSCFWLKGGSRIGLVGGRTPPPLTLMNPDGSGAKDIFTMAFAVPSPDGNKLLVRHGMRPGQEETILITDAQGGSQRVIYKTTLEEGVEPGIFSILGGVFSGEMAWSPDGKRVAFTVFRHKQTDILVAAADGSWVRELAAGPQDDCYPVWSPDGSKILFLSFPTEFRHEKDTSLWTFLYFAMVNSDGSNLRRFSGFESIVKQELADLIGCLSRSKDDAEAQKIGERLGMIKYWTSHQGMFEPERPRETPGEIAQGKWFRELAALTRAPDAAVRQGALIALGSFMEIKDIIPIGAALCEDEDEAVQMAAVEALSKHESAMAAAFLTYALENQPSPKVKEKAARTIEKWGKIKYFWVPKQLKLNQATKALMRLLDDKDRALQEAATDALLEIDDPEAAGALARLLSREEGRRARILQYLSRVGDSEDVQTRWEQIVRDVAPFLEDPSPGVREAAISVLGKIGKKASRDRIAAHLEDPDEGVKAMAAVALCELKDKRGFNGIRRALTSEDWQLRRRAVGSLSGFVDPEVLDILLEVVRDPERGTQVEGVKQICARNDPNIFDVLVNLLDDPPMVYIDTNGRQLIRNLRVRVRLIDELPRFGLDRTTVLLLRLLKEDPDHRVREECARVLGIAGVQEAVPALTDSLRDDADYYVGSWAAHALGLIGGEKSLEALRAFVQGPLRVVRRDEHCERLVREAAEKAIQSLTMRTKHSAGSASGEAATKKGFFYRVKDGDTLWGIAIEHGVTLEGLLRANEMDLSGSPIAPGQRIFIPTKE